MKDSKIKFDNSISSRVIFEMPNEDFETVLKMFEKESGQKIYDKDEILEEQEAIFKNK